MQLIQPPHAPAEALGHLLPYCPFGPRCQVSLCLHWKGLASEQGMACSVCCLSMCLCPLARHTHTHQTQACAPLEHQALLSPGPWHRDSKSYSYKAVARWTKAAKLRLAGQGLFTSVLQYSRLVVPLNHGNSHWTCAVIDLAHQELVHLDSMNVGSSGHLTAADALKNRGAQGSCLPTCYRAEVAPKNIREHPQLHCWQPSCHISCTWMCWGIGWQLRLWSGVP